MIIEHITIVGAAVALTILIGVPLGIFAYFYVRIRRVILWFAEVLQTVPALALLGIIMVFLGAGKPTVIIGLLLYSLLPVVHNTYVGLSEVDPAIKEVAFGMGMTRLYCLIHIELPIAFPLIFTGIRIATVTAVGTAVFATFVGGGGLGSVIYRGIRISNLGMIVSGTLILIIMAMGCDGIMALVERRLYCRFTPNRLSRNKTIQEQEGANTL
jgi:osmoprotectant transport system permease protein